MPNLYDSSQLVRTLDKEQFSVTRRKQTQQAFKNQYWDNFKPGIYKCVVCDRHLFSSEKKYQDGFGWPAFYDELPEARIKKVQDHQLDYVRTEAVCSKCNSHLGYIFPDGPPKKTGLRYSINSASMKFSPK